MYAKRGAVGSLTLVLWLYLSPLVAQTPTIKELFGFPCIGSTLVCPDGSGPAGGLVQASDGNFYGTTITGGSRGAFPTNGGGTIFQITPSGRFTLLHNFVSQVGGSFPLGMIP